MHEFKGKPSLQRIHLIKSEAFVCTAHGLQSGDSLASYFFWVYISMTRLLQHVWLGLYLQNEEKSASNPFTTWTVNNSFLFKMVQHRWRRAAMNWTQCIRKTSADSPPGYEDNRLFLNMPNPVWSFELGGMAVFLWTWTFTAGKDSGTAGVQCR